MKKIMLTNKMPVLVMEDPDSPVATLDVWVNTGSALEPKDINGVSHFLEHMIFKGTELRGAGEVDREIESVGGLWNAGTSIEFTHYYLTVGTPFVNTGIDVLSDVIANSKLDPLELERERQVILEEYHRQQDNPAHFLMTEAWSLSFEKSPNRWPVLGVPKTINAITREKLHKYYTSRYTPENMVLVIAGGVRVEDIKPVLEEKFGSINRPFRKPRAGGEKTIRTHGLYGEFEKPIRESYILFTFPAPDLGRPKDVYSFDLLSYILGEGRSSRLYRRIKEDKRLVSSISASYPTHRRDSLFYIFATFDYSKKQKVIDSVTRELNRIFSSRVSGKELEKAKRLLTNHYLFSNETTGGRTSETGFYYTLTGDTRFERNYLKKIGEVTPEDIRKVAGKFLKPEKANIFIVKPEE